VDVQGAAALTARLEKLADAARNRVTVAIREELQGAADQARADVPVRTGALRDSIRVEIGQAGISGQLIAGGKKAPHAHLVEFGTRKAVPHAFLFPAGEQARRALNERLPKILEDERG
jgi:HK97 gp10 family phage protein